MNTTVTIESKNHKYQHTFGGLIENESFLYSSMSDVTDNLISTYDFNTFCKCWAELRDKRNDN